MRLTALRAAANAGRSGSSAQGRLLVCVILNAEDPPVTERIGPTVLDDTDQTIVNALPGGKRLLTSVIAKTIGLTPRATRTRLARLVGSELLREIGTGPQDPKRRRFRAE